MCYGSPYLVGRTVTPGGPTHQHHQSPEQKGTTMHVLSQCDHRHMVSVTLSESEQFTIPSRHKDGKPTVVVRVAIAAAPGSPVSTASVGGWYAKADGTASKTRNTWPPTVALADLPETVRAGLLQGLREVSCG